MVKMKKKTRIRLVRVLAVVLCVLMLLPIASYFIPSDSATELPVVYVEGDELEELAETDSKIPENCTGPYEVVGVKTGDCLHIAVKKDEFVYVDLLGIETEKIPEGEDTDGQSAGIMAYEHARTLVQGKQVYLDYGGEFTENDTVNALVYLDDGTLLNEQMLKDGFAKVSQSVPKEQKDAFAAAMQDARENKKGLWNKSWNETN